jgi:hypothetical protein
LEEGQNREDKAEEFAGSSAFTSLLRSLLTTMKNGIFVHNSRLCHWII